MAKEADDPNDLDWKAVGRRIRLARDAVRKTQDEFGEPIGLGGSTIGNYETGTRKVPPGSAVALCRAWGLTLDYIYRGEVGTVPYDLGKAIKAIMELEARAPAAAPKKRSGQRKKPSTSTTR